MESLLGRVQRGGTYEDDGCLKPVSTREEKTVSSCESEFGFRIALYLQ